MMGGGIVLQNTRKLKEMTQGQLAEKSGVNVRMLQYYEQGKKNINGAKLDTLIDLALALECKVSDLLTDEKLKEKCQKLHI